MPWVFLNDQKAVNPLLKALGDKGSEVRAAAVKALAQLSPPGFEVRVLAMMDEEDGDVRASAAEALGEVGGNAVVEPLIGASTDRKPEVRSAAGRTLGILNDPCWSL